MPVTDRLARSHRDFRKAEAENCACRSQDLPSRSHRDFRKAEAGRSLHCKVSICSPRSHRDFRKAEAGIACRIDGSGEGALAVIAFSERLRRPEVDKSPTRS
jgi:hypothetical protein